MASVYPNNLDSFTNPNSTDNLDNPSHSLQHSNSNDAIEAIETKLGIGDSPAGSATNGQFLTANGGGSSSWTTLSVLDSVTINNSTLNTNVINNSLLTSPEESINVVGSATSGTVNLNLKDSGVNFYTSDSTGNWTLNFIGDGSTTLNDLIDTNQSISHVFLNTNGATPYYADGFQIDGTAVTPKWLGGSALNAGSANSIDSYAFTIIKTSGTPTYTVLASQSQFA